MPSRRFLADKQQKLFLATMARNFRVRPADYVGIQDESIAFYFDVECNEALSEFDAERFRDQLEAASLGSLGMGSQRSIGEITESSFTEQAY